MAPVKAPRSYPNSSASRSCSGKAAQLTATKGPPARGEWLWIERATRSLPVPDSPITSTLECVQMTEPERVARAGLEQHDARSEQAEHAPRSVDRMSDDREPTCTLEHDGRELGANGIRVDDEGGAANHRLGVCETRAFLTDYFYVYNLWRIRHNYGGVTMVAPPCCWRSMTTRSTAGCS
mgnify:CR=1 FL=1